MSELRTFQADSLPAALAKVKRAFGPDAVIVGTRTLSVGPLGALLPRKRVEITAGPAAAIGQGTPHGAKGKPIRAREGANASAAAPQPRAHRSAPGPDGIPLPWSPATVVPSLSHAPQNERRPALSPGTLDAYFRELVAAEVSEDLAKRVLADAVRAAPHADFADSGVQRRLIQEAIARLVPTADGIDLPGGRMFRVALVGPPGAGKTTVLAKLAAHFKLRMRQRVALISADLHRLAAGEQLQRYGELIAAPVRVVQSVTQMHEAVRAFEREHMDLLLIDTPGLGLREAARRARLHALLRAGRPDEVHLVLPASLSAAVQERMAERFADLQISRVVLTHLDSALGLGVVLNAMAHVRWKLSYLSTGQNVPRDLERACSRDVAALIFPTIAAGAS